MKHLTSDQLQEFADGFIDPQCRNEIDLHLITCDECSGKMKSLRLFESTLKNIPLERVDPKFTQRVMEHLRIKESPSFLWAIFKNLAPLFGLFIVIGIVYGVFKFTGMLESSGVGESITATQSAYKSVADQVSTGVSAFNGWLKNLFPFLYTKSSYGLTAFLIVLFIIVALLDKFVFMPMFRKRV
ncbi:MAG: hypothetical protein QME52_08395 [Bacteroidota bacterium]|nr:hypothetical protein [Bacteroidota bacterium]